MTVTRPTRIRDGKDGPQRIRPGRKRWSDEAEATFLDMLAATCNVTAAAEACGFVREGLYARRRADPAFAARWRDALDHGYAELEAELLRAAVQPPGDEPRSRPLRFPDLTSREAILLLQLHRAAVRGGAPQRYDWRKAPRGLDEVRDSILRKLDCIEAARLERLGPSAPPADAPA